MQLWYFKGQLFILQTYYPVKWSLMSVLLYLTKDFCFLSLQWIWHLYWFAKKKLTWDFFSINQLVYSRFTHWIPVFPCLRWPLSLGIVTVVHLQRTLILVNYIGLVFEVNPFLFLPKKKCLVGHLL